MIRLILAVFGGMVIVAIASTAVDAVMHSAGVYPPVGEPMFDTIPLLLALAYRSLFEVGGAYLTAMWARERARHAVLTMGVIGSLLWVVGGIVMSEYGPAWYSITGAVSSIPLALVGGMVYERRIRSAQTNS